MPTLHWIGKEAVVKHHKDVPYRLLEPVAALSCIPSSPASPSPLAPLPQGGEGKTAPSPFKGEGWGEGKSSPSLHTHTNSTQNLIVQGDNLHALKALLPRYAGQVKCIYIDPPYNTGNEGWVYNDNVNSAEIKRWLGEVVGKEGETLDRHDRWLCMMYPRLLLLKQFLREDGAIFISIDDNEVASLRLLMDEIFGAGNFLANVVWQKRTSPDARLNLGPAHDHIIVYAKNLFLTKSGLHKVQLSDGRTKDFKNPDNDSRGVWASVDLTGQTGHATAEQFYEITTPNGKKFKPPNNRCWALAERTFNALNQDGRIWFGKDGNAKPRQKRFLSEAEGTNTWTWWTNEDVGHNQEATKQLLEIVESDVSFETPKPTRLIQRILQIATDKDSLILDSFAGSGTTAHAVLKQNAEDGGNRRFILVEMDENIAQNVTAERVRRVAQGYVKGAGQSSTRSDRTGVNLDPTELNVSVTQSVRPEQVEGQKWVAGLGGGFQFCKLSGEPLFTALGQIRSDVTFAQLAEFVWFVETGTGFSPSPQPSTIKGEGVKSQQARAPALHNQPATNNAEEAMLPSPLVGEGLGERGWTSPLLGIHQGRAIYLLYNGILKDKSVGGGNVLTQKVLDILPKHDGAKVIFAAANRLGAPKLASEQIVFKQTPYALNV